MTLTRLTFLVLRFRCQASYRFSLISSITYCIA
jgi:hypothetical protein